MIRKVNRHIIVYYISQKLAYQSKVSEVLQKGVEYVVAGLSDDAFP